MKLESINERQKKGHTRMPLRRRKWLMRMMRLIIRRLWMNKFFEDAVEEEEVVD